MDVVQQLRGIYNTLNRMTISGDSNVECLYGCYYTLTQLIQYLEAQQVEAEKTQESSK